jgi:hypothetical protein
MRLAALLLTLLLTGTAAAQTCPTPAQLTTDLDAASQAAVISLSGVNPLACPEVPMVQTWDGGKLIFSDSPEKPTLRGKLYEDATLGYTSGTVYNRVFAYHVNGYGGSTKMKFAILLKNTSGASGTLTLQRSGTAGPTTSYLYAGKLAFQRWLTSTAAAPVSVAAGQTVRLTTAIETLASPNNLMHGIYDYSFSQSHQLTVCALNQNDDPVSVCPGLAVLSRDTHQRGTFPYAEKIYDTASGVQIDTAGGVQQLPLAGNTPADSAAVGTDATDGSQQTLAGNYGVLYKLHLNTKATDGKKLGILINPRGGQWGGAQWAVAGITPGGKILIPDSSGSTGDNTKGAVSGKWSPGSSLTVWCQFMPTGGAAFPLRFVPVPY